MPIFRAQQMARFSRPRVDTHGPGRLHVHGRNISNPQVVTSRGVFALTVLWQAPFDEALFAERRELLRAALLQQKQQRALEGSD